jgi:hypothetical protein
MTTVLRLRETALFVQETEGISGITDNCAHIEAKACVLFLRSDSCLHSNCTVAELELFHLQGPGDLLCTCAQSQVEWSNVLSWPRVDLAAPQA